MARNRRQYRSRVRIAADILEIAKVGSRKTRIMYLGNLSFDLLQKYLELLARHGLIEVRNGNETTYFATEKGQRFLEEFHELERYSDLVQEKKRILETSFAT